MRDASAILALLHFALGSTLAVHAQPPPARIAKGANVLIGRVLGIGSGAPVGGAIVTIATLVTTPRGRTGPEMPASSPRPLRYRGCGWCRGERSGRPGVPGSGARDSRQDHSRGGREEEAGPASRQIRRVVPLSRAQFRRAHEQVVLLGRTCRAVRGCRVMRDGGRMISGIAETNHESDALFST